MNDRWSLMGIRHRGQTLMEALHDAVEGQDHAAARDIARAAFEAGLAAALPPDAGVGYPRRSANGIGRMDE